MRIRSAQRIGLLALMCLNMGCAASVNQWVGDNFPALAHRHKSAQTLKRLKNPAGTLLAAARFHEHVGNLSGAREAYDLMLTENSKSTEAVLGLARLDQLAGRSAEAEQAYLKALKQKPNDPHVLDAAGQFYLSQERWDMAQNLLNRAMLAAPENKTIRHHLAVALARSGNAEAALPHFVRAIGDAEAHYNVALVLHDQGKLEECEQHLLQAVIKKPEFQEAQYWLDEIRREREAQQVLARGYPAANQIGGESAVQQSGHFTTSAPDPRVVRAVNHRPVNDAAAGNRSSVPASPPAASNLTAEQLEQRMNQTN